MTWIIEQTQGGAMGPKYSIRSGDLWLGHLYMDDISKNVDIKQVLNIITAAPELLEALELHTNIMEAHCAQSFMDAGGDRILKETHKLIAKTRGQE